MEPIGLFNVEYRVKSCQRRETRDSWAENCMKTLAAKHLLFVLAITLALYLASSPAQADDWPQWRGPQRNGVSRETGLLKQWPQEGPKLHWKLNDTGRGYSTPAVVGDRLYLLSNEGLENEFVAALSVKDGKR